MSTRMGIAKPTERPPAGKPRPARRRMSLRDARIRSKLGFLLIVPLAAIVALAAVRLVDSGQLLLSARLVNSLSAVSVDVSGATQDLQKERMTAALLLGGDKTTTADTYKKQTKLTDAAVAVYSAHRAKLSGLPTGISDRLDNIDSRLRTLDAIRDNVSGHTNLSVSEVVVQYEVIINNLIAYQGEIATVAGNTTVANTMRSIAAFATAKAQTAQEQAVAYSALYAGSLDQQQYSAFIATLTGQQEALSSFNLTASPTQRALVDGAITGDSVQLASQVAVLMGRSIGLAKPAITAADAANELGALVDLMRWTEQQLDNQLISQAKSEQTSVTRQVVVESVLVILVLIIALILAAIVARSLARSLTRLREGALSVAERDLPEAVARLRDMQGVGENSPEDIARDIVDPIRIDSRDEVGQVAKAFNAVHREAVRVAAEQAALRTSVSAMFLNLARRSQTLVDRIIGELDDIERSEEDPKRLSRLFQLDHLATRMRRNDENLLILAGADSSPPRRDDALLVDVVRAAQSEVEQYNRIEFATVDQDVSIAAHVVNDVVRLLAELLDNATRFSPPQASVVVDARRIGDYVLLQVEDRGLGMTAEQMGLLNQRLAEPPTVDVAAFRMMGLAVVARLADRYQIKVELRPNTEGGTVTNVTLPTPVLILPRLRGREPVLPRPRSPLAVERAPANAPAPGWPMPQLPGLASGADTNRSVSPTVNGWAQPAETNGHHWPTSNPGQPSPMHQPTMPVPPVSSPMSAPPMSAPPAPVSPSPVSAVPVSAAPISAAPVSASTAEALGYSTGSQRAVPPADDTTELPIFRAMEAVWFRSHAAGDEWSASAFAVAPTASVRAVPQPTQPAAPPLPQRNAAQTSYVPQSYSAPAAPLAAPPPPPPPPPVAPPPVTPPPSRPMDSGEWRTAADDGWRAAAAAAAPVASGTTRSGLPKRVPAAQLVPGGVETRPASRNARRTPEEVRGLLSAYHRGVQRGRAGEDPRSPDADGPANKETN